MRKKLQLQQKEQADLAKKELVGLLLRLTNAHTESEMVALEEDLLDAYRRVIEAVSTRKLSQDDFDSYSGMWDKAVASVRHHLATIRGGYQVGATPSAL